MSRSLLKCHFCPWEHVLSCLDDAQQLASLHATHLAQHVEDIIRTSFLPYDEDSFIHEPRHTFARSFPPRGNV